MVGSYSGSRYKRECGLLSAISASLTAGASPRPAGEKGVPRFYPGTGRVYIAAASAGAGVCIDSKGAKGKRSRRISFTRARLRQQGSGGIKAEWNGKSGGGEPFPLCSVPDATGMGGDRTGIRRLW